MDEPWDDVTCAECNSPEDPGNMVLCDGCDVGWHLQCARPRLTSVKPVTLNPTPYRGTSLIRNCPPP